MLIVLVKEKRDKTDWVNFPGIGKSLAGKLMNDNG